MAFFTNLKRGTPRKLLFHHGLVTDSTLDLQSLDMRLMAERNRLLNRTVRCEAPRRVGEKYTEQEKEYN